jgi:hypothetical protein
MWLLGLRERAGYVSLTERFYRIRLYTALENAPKVIAV